MKSTVISITFILFHFFSIGQSDEFLVTDNNPKLSLQESTRLNALLKPEDFNFDGKIVGFYELLSGGFYGIGKFTLPMKKKVFFNIDLTKHLYRLYILNEEEKRNTKGFDAVIVVASKSIKGKLRRLNRETVIRERNWYPQIPADAGKDNNPLLDQANVEFFNQIYKYGHYDPIDIDFSGKKLAIFQTDCAGKVIRQRTIAEYVGLVKNKLDQDGFFMTEETVRLTEDQKKESGGYDIIIRTFCKKGFGVGSLVDWLKKNGK